MGYSSSSLKHGLQVLESEGIVDEVIGRLKTGKEAEVWLVRHAGEIVAAKVYLERHRRLFRNHAAYQDGRQVRDSRTQRAMRRGSRFGQAAAEEAWKSAEADALFKLWALGVRVPKPLLFYEGVLLMEVVVDADGHPAPRLLDAPIAPEAAGALYAQLRTEVVKMLCADLIHGDLSPFNVLLGWDGPTIIDFPQIVSAAHHGNAERLLHRDLENLRTFFAGLDRSLEERRGDSHEIWRAYSRRELAPDFVPDVRAPGRSLGGPRSKEGGRPPSAAGRPLDARPQRGARPPHPMSQGAQGARGNHEAQPRSSRQAPSRGRVSPRPGPEVSYRGQPPSTAGSGQRPASSQSSGASSSASRSEVTAPLHARRRRRRPRR